MMDRDRHRIKTIYVALPGALLLPIGLRDELAGSEASLTNRLLPGSRSGLGTDPHRKSRSFPSGNKSARLLKELRITSRRVSP